MFLSNKKLPIALPCVSFHSSLALISKTILDIAKLQIKPDKKDDLNLVLMENALRVLIVNIVNKFTFCVLILVLMENALRESQIIAGVSN